MADPRKVWASDPQYLKAAFSKLGLSEIAGRLNEKQVLAMYAASGHPEIEEDEVPWCAAFVGWCLVQGNLPNTRSLLAISYAKYGTGLPKNKPIPRGAIAVWKRTGGNHVNFVLADDGTNVICIGGNQENGKGGGVTISTRSKAAALAYRMPVNVAAVEAVAAVEPDQPPAADKVTLLARVGAASAGLVPVAGQVAKSSLDSVSDAAEKVTEVVDKSGHIVEASKQIVAIPKPGFWNGVLHIVTSPGFAVSMVVLILALWALVVVWQRMQRKVTQ